MPVATAWYQPPYSASARQSRPKLTWSSARAIPADAVRIARAVMIERTVFPPQAGQAAAPILTTSPLFSTSGPACYAAAAVVDGPSGQRRATEGVMKEHIPGG